MVLWQQHLRCHCLYDPVGHIESARLYGNIDEYAYYYVDMLIGTPPQRVSVIVDTGSGVTAFSCRSCKHCGHHIDPNFDFDSSSSAKWVPCEDEICRSTCLGVDTPHCGYQQSYTEGSSISGWYFQDFARIGDFMQHNPPVRMMMGCHQDEHKLFFTQAANGILGLRPPAGEAASLLENLFADQEHVDARVFSLCLAEWGGRMVVGGYNSTEHTGEIRYMPMVVSGGYYYVPLGSMVVDGRTLRGNFGKAMIDSGTTYTYMASEPYRSLKTAIESYCKEHDDCGVTWRGPCVEALHGLSRFPPVEVWFDSGRVKTVWDARGYFYRKGETITHCYAFQDDGPRANTVLGASWMLHHEIIFDFREKRVGVAPANCPEVKERPFYDAKQAAEPSPTAPPGGSSPLSAQVASRSDASADAGSSVSSSLLAGALAVVALGMLGGSRLLRRTSASARAAPPVQPAQAANANIVDSTGGSPERISEEDARLLKA